VNLKVGGPAWKPVITDMDLSAAVTSIARQAASSAFSHLFESFTGGSGQQDNPQQPSAEPKDDAEKAHQQIEEAKKRLKELLGH